MYGEVPLKLGFLAVVAEGQAIVPCARERGVSRCTSKPARRPLHAQSRTYSTAESFGPQTEKSPAPGGGKYVEKERGGAVRWQTAASVWRWAESRGRGGQIDAGRQAGCLCVQRPLMLRRLSALPLASCGWCVRRATRLLFRSELA